MDTETILRVLKEAQAELKTLGVRSLSLFGSVARGEARPDSDVDLLAELEPMGIVRRVGIEDRLRKALHRQVDLVNRKYIKPALKDSIERSPLHIF